jgi:hypothetical protein
MGANRFANNIIHCAEPQGRSGKQFSTAPLVNCRLITGLDSIVRGLFGLRLGFRGRLGVDRHVRARCNMRDDILYLAAQGVGGLQR